MHARAAVAAIDVGGTTIKAGRRDTVGLTHTLAPVPTPVGAQAVVDTVADLVHRLRLADPTVAAAGVVVPGIVDTMRGVGVLSENLRWHDAPLRDLLFAATGLPIALDHDVRAAARAEQRIGGESDLAVIVIGTGIAAGIFCDGRLLDGGGMAGEIGHSIVDPGGPMCVCGSRGCLEAIASAGAITRRYAAVSGTAVSGAAAVLLLARSGDVTAQEIWADAISALAAATRQLVAIAGTRHIALAGGLSLAGDALVEPLQRQIGETLTPQSVPSVRVAHVGASGGLLGAFDLAHALTDPRTGTL